MTKSRRELIKFWRDSADKNWAAAQSLFRLKHYDMSLFCCHLTIEKYIKALLIQNTQESPLIWLSRSR